ncbi:MAG: NAD-dependent DNA ligase LigA, partial [Planctomycetales bacterium]|nr:NAD-dependent DNA ligase LigA [Planctomycetales bacterium]
MATSSTAQQRIEALRREIREHDRRYYSEAQPVISDRDYDKLIDELKELESQHPELVTQDSPTQRIGDAPVPHLEQVAHREPMLSIDNTYNEAELRKYVQRIDKLLEGEAVEWVVELKIDGVAVSLWYEHGLLVRGLTRGNGRVGDD